MTEQYTSRFPIATAMRQAMAGYGWHNLRCDVQAALVVSLLALPLSMALSIAVGLPPQHGIYTAIIAGIAAALLGGSAVQVSGPTAAFVVVVAPIVSTHGYGGLIWCTLMAGGMLVLMSIARLGRYISFVPYPVTTGFTAGIATVIATLSLNDLLGLGITTLPSDYPGKLTAILSALPQTNLYELAIGLSCLLLMLTFGRITRLLPTTVVGIGIATLLGLAFQHYGIAIDTIGSRFHFTDAHGLMVQGIPPNAPHWQLPAWPGYDTLRALLMPAATIAALGALESLLSATVADSMTNSRHNPHAELAGIGVANVLSALGGGIPATGAIARTSANIHHGARSPLAAVMHALLILVYVLALTPVINHIPMSALAALLLLTAWRMSHLHQCIRIVRFAPSSDVMVLTACYFLTVFIDMVAGVSVGIILAALLFIKRIADASDLEVFPAGNHRADVPSLPADALVLHMNGPLFFGTAEKAFGRSRFVADHIRWLILDVRDVPMIDMTALVAMRAMIASVMRPGRQIILCGQDEIAGRIRRKLQSAHPEYEDRLWLASSLGQAAEIVFKGQEAL